MATSLNGIIAGKNGDEDFLSDDNWRYFSEMVGSFRNLVIGRKTFESVRKWNNDYGFDDFKEAVRIVVSRDTQYDPGEGYVPASDPKTALEYLKQKGFDAVLIAGGSGLNSSFISKHLIDEIILQINPVIVGQGVPLFSPDDFECDLKYVSAKQLRSGMLRLQYEVIK